MAIKNKGKIERKLCTECFKPQYLKTNFSYIVYEDDFSEQYQIQLLKRLRELSVDTYNVVRLRGKEVGFEFLDKDELGIKKALPTKFTERFDAKEYNNKLAIMRLYTNNNPILARIIGVIIKNVFYVFFIDIGGNLYKH